LFNVAWVVLSDWRRTGYTYNYLNRLFLRANTYIHPAGAAVFFSPVKDSI
jgi:hypothetical protein